jgi:phospholipid transport system substrate-binding protein
MVITTFLPVFFAGAVAASAPAAAIQLTVDSVLEVLRDKDLSHPDKKQERRKKIRIVIRDRFDYEEMAKRSLARHWQKRTPEEKKEFIAIYSDLLESSYIGKIETYTDERVTYDKEVVKGKGKYGIVNTTIITKSVDIPIDYKVIHKNGKWWVYDVVIEGVSFISTYRSQYNKIIVKESYAKLIKRMKSKLDDLNAL